MTHSIRPIEYSIPMCFSFKFGQTLTELVKEHKTIHILHMDFFYPEDRPVWKISTRTNELKQLIDIVKPKRAMTADFLDMGVSVQYEALTGRKFFRTLFLFSLSENQKSVANETLQYTADTISREWELITKTPLDCFSGHMEINEVSDSLLVKLGVDIRDPYKLKLKLNEEYTCFVNHFQKTCVLKLSLHVPFTYSSQLTQTQYDEFVAILNDKLNLNEKDVLAGQLHIFKQENQAGCFDVVLFLNGEKTIPQSESFLQTMKLIEDSWYAVTKHRFVIIEHGFLTTREQEQKSSVRRHRVLLPFLNGL